MPVFDSLNRTAGWCELRVRGALPAAFLNRCARCGVELLCAEAEDPVTLLVRIRSRDRKRAERLAARCQCTATLSAVGGAGVFGRRLLRRSAAVLGLLLALALLCASRCFLWEITVTGNETVPTGRVLDALADCGVDLGCFWPGLTSDNLRSELLVRLPELAWATVNVYGSRAEVLVRERVPKPAIWRARDPTDLTAKHAGFVTKVLALNGTALVRPGSAVDAGEVLIAGYADSAFGGRRTLHAAGEVWADTWYELRAATPLDRAEKGGIEEKSARWALVIGKNRLNFYRGSSISDTNCDMISKEWRLALAGWFSLPVSLVRETALTRPGEDGALDERLACEQLEAELHDRLLRAIGPEGTVCEEHYSTTRSGGLLTVCLRARCTENLAVERPITTETE